MRTTHTKCARISDFNNNVKLYSSI